MLLERLLLFFFGVACGFFASLTVAPSVAGFTGSTGSSGTDPCADVRLEVARLQLRLTELERWLGPDVALEQASDGRSMDRWRIDTILRSESR